MGLVSATVLIDTYNHGAFLDEAIESVLDQDYPAEQTEVLVVDDGSTDGTSERVKKYGQRVHYIYKPNGGQASAFNIGLASSHGEIVLLLDGDDCFLPGKIRRVVQEFQKNPNLGMVYHPYLEVDMRTHERRKGQFNAISGSIWEDEEAFFWYVPAGTCASYRRDKIEQLLPIPEGLRTQADGYLSSLIVYEAEILAI